MGKVFGGTQDETLWTGIVTEDGGVITCGWTASNAEVYPNPSKDYVILEYKLEMEQEGSIEIQDVAGKAIRTIPTHSIRDQITVITTDWKPGVYIATLKLAGKSKESVKFTLVK